MKKLLLATHNKAKLEELKLGIKDLIKKGATVVSLNDLKIKKDVEETGKTFTENAILKAIYYGELTGLPTLADDGGLIIPYLNNEPGIKSKRWLGYDASDEELINHALLHLRGVKGSARKAYLQTCLCFYDPSTKQPICEEEKINGYIGEKSSGNQTHGFPYRSLLIVDRFNKYYDEMTEEEHRIINHRLKALKRLTKKIETYLIQ